ncbi:MAG: thiamine pyrophosphate-binding protein [Ornithinimicrobium sp.]|uniref:thiamine pyrophosphate-binding protein n=1 Tax=Ornithinimicrobium sp. TaxID=1977084 RepID=UPI0026DEE86D|nr:thiamine pyrophosphate-binding protein [Ornithinimicrobium sp.]MDO5739970.1 thiamine pyrophosphate-binding protein [Ornithinimicrobium sp.]
MAATLHRLGLSHVFGVVGSGNYVVTNELVRRGATYVPARHETGAGMMADAYARVSGEMTALSLHQGCGLTNALTSIVEASKSRTPMLVLTGDTPPTVQTSNFWVDQEAVLVALGVEVHRVHSAATAVLDTVRAFRRARDARHTVVLNLPLDVQDEPLDLDESAALPLDFTLTTAGATDEGAELVAQVLREARRPVVVGGRGALQARSELEVLAQSAGALLSTSAVARGLFEGDPWYVDVMGGFATPAAAELIAGADALVAFGASLNRWTSRSGDLLKDKVVVVVDADADAIGFHHGPDHAVVGDSATVAAAAAKLLGQRPDEGYRTAEVRARLEREGRWRQVPYEDTGTETHIDPRTLSIALDDLLPKQRVVVPDGGNFNGYPAMFLAVPDARGFVLPLAFQSIGLSLGAAIGAALALPDRVAVAGVGDGGLMMSLTELDTAVRLRLPLVVLVYNDDAYGAEVHHFADDHEALGTVVFPDTDIAAIARGFGCEAVTVRSTHDLGPVREWVDGPRERPLLIDAKITSFPSWVLAHTFQGEK